MTMELTYGLSLVVILVFLIIFAVRQNKADKQIIAETAQKPQTPKKPKKEILKNSIEAAAEKVMEEAVALAPVVETVVEALVVKPKKKRKYKPRNPQNKK